MVPKPLLPHHRSNNKQHQIRQLFIIAFFVIFAASISIYIYCSQLEVWCIVKF